MSTPRRHLGAGAALSVLAQAGPLLAAAVLSIVLARTIGPSGNGRFALLVTLSGITSLVVSLGLHAGITYEVSRRRWSCPRAFRTSYRTGSSSGSSASLGGLGVFIPLQRLGVRRDRRSTWRVLALASLPPVLAYQYADAILLARERYEAYAWTSELAHAAVLFVVGAGLAIPFGLDRRRHRAFSRRRSSARLVGGLLLAQEARRDIRLRQRRLACDGRFRFGLQSWGANLLQQVNYRFDIVILAGFATARDVGVYSVALTLTGIAWVLPQALQTVLFPRTASLDEAAIAGRAEPADESDDALAKAIRHGVLLTLPAAARRPPPARRRAAPLRSSSTRRSALGFILLPGVLLLGIGKILSSAIAGRGYPRYTLYVGRSRDAAHARPLLRADPAFRGRGGGDRVGRISYAFDGARASGLLPAGRPASGSAEAFVPTGRGRGGLPRCRPARTGRFARGGRARSERADRARPARRGTRPRGSRSSGPFVRDQPAQRRPMGTAWSCSSTRARRAGLAASSRLSEEHDGAAAGLSARLPPSEPVTARPTCSASSASPAGSPREGTPVDVIHAHVHRMGWPAVLAGRLLRRPVVITEHSTEWPRGRSRRSASPRAFRLPPRGARLSRQRAPAERDRGVRRAGALPDRAERRRHVRLPAARGRQPEPARRA